MEDLKNLKSDPTTSSGSRSIGVRLIAAAFALPFLLLTLVWILSRESIAGSFLKSYLWVTLGGLLLLVLSRLVSLLLPKRVQPFAAFAVFTVALFIFLSETTMASKSPQLSAQARNWGRALGSIALLAAWVVCLASLFVRLVNVNYTFPSSSITLPDSW
jgi:hypothetical protein